MPPHPYSNRTLQMRAYLTLLRQKRFVMNPGSLPSYLTSFGYLLDFVKSTRNEEVSCEQLRDFKEEIKS